MFDNEKHVTIDWTFVDNTVLINILKLTTNDYKSLTRFKRDFYHQ